MGLDNLNGLPSSEIQNPGEQAPAKAIEDLSEAMTPPSTESVQLDERTMVSRLLNIRNKDGIEIPLPEARPDTQKLKELLEQHEYAVIGRIMKLLPDVMNPVLKDDPILGNRWAYPIEDFMTSDELSVVRNIGSLVGEDFVETPDYDQKSRGPFLNASRRALHAQALMMYGVNPPKITELNSSFTLKEHQAALQDYAERLGVPLNLLPLKGQFDFLRQIDEKKQAEARLQQNPRSARDVEREEDRKDAELGIELLAKMKKMKW